MWKTEGLPSEVARLGTVRELGRQEYLFRQGDPISHVFEVLAGRLRLVRRTVDDHLVVLHTARSGELFAESTDVLFRLRRAGLRRRRPQVRHAGLFRGHRRRHHQSRDL